MRRSALSVACFVGFFLGTLALGQGTSGDFSWPISGSSKSEGGFSAMLLMSDNPDEVIRAWDAPDAGVTVRAVNTIGRGVPIVGFVFFTGCLPNEEGNCNASVDFRILGPDGSEYVSFPGRDLWRHKPAPPENMLRLAAEYVGVVIEPQDLPGEYEVYATVHDLNAGTTLELKQTFTAR